MIGTALIAAVLGAASQPTVTVTASPDSVVFGEAFILTISVHHDPAVTVSLPRPLELGPALVEWSRTSAQTAHLDGTVADAFSLEVLAYGLGRVDIRGIAVNYEAGGVVESVPGNPVGIDVVSFIGDDEFSLRPSPSPVQVMRRDWTLVYVASGLVGSLALGLALRSLRRRRRLAALHGLRTVPLLPADQEALERLAVLEASGLLDSDPLGPAYTALSEIARAYLGRRYDFPALDLTTGEILRRMSENTDASAFADELAPWLEECDAVKFANYPASPDEARTALYRVRVIVQRSSAARPTGTASFSGSASAAGSSEESAADSAEEIAAEEGDRA